MALSLDGEALRRHDQIEFRRFHEGVDLPWPLSCHLPWMRVNVLLCSGFTFYTCAAALCIRPNVRVQQHVPLEQAWLEPMPSKCVGLRTFVRVVYGSGPFWRLLIISLIVAVGTRATFRHLDATFPKYFMRMWGDDGARATCGIRTRATCAPRRARHDARATTRAVRGRP